jgi:hypothetical protein
VSSLPDEALLRAWCGGDLRAFTGIDRSCSAEISVPECVGLNVLRAMIGMERSNAGAIVWG